MKIDKKHIKILSQQYSKELIEDFLTAAERIRTYNGFRYRLGGTHLANIAKSYYIMRDAERTKINKQNHEKRVEEHFASEWVNFDRGTIRQFLNTYRRSGSSEGFEVVFETFPLEIQIIIGFIEGGSLRKKAQYGLRKLKSVYR